MKIVVNTMVIRLFKKIVYWRLILEKKVGYWEVLINNRQWLTHNGIATGITGEM